MEIKGALPAVTDIRPGKKAGETIGLRKVRKTLSEYKRRPLSGLMLLLTIACAAVTFGIIVFLLVYILVKGVPYLSPSLFEWKYTTENQSMMPAIINTLTVTLISLLIAAPLGIFSAIYTVEYASKDNKFINVVRIATETLSGIPSIVYGLFGMLCFVSFFKWGYSIISGACTLAIMILPLIMRTCEEALLAVPDAYRQASFGLGAGKLRTVFRIVLPSAVPGILSGIILATGRIVGETAALLYTAGTISKAASLTSSGRTLAIHMYVLSNEGLYVNEAYASSVVLILLVLFINMISRIIAGRFREKK